MSLAGSRIGLPQAVGPGSVALALTLAGWLSGCAVPPALENPGLARLRIVDLPALDTQQLELPPLAVLLEVAPTIEDSARVSPGSRSAYEEHACRTAEAFLKRVDPETPIRVQRFRTRKSNSKPCTVDVAARPRTDLAPEIWEVDAPATAFLRWAENPARSEQRIQLVTNLDLKMVQELCQVASPWTAEGIWFESIRLDGGPPIRGCLADPPQAPDTRVLELIEAATPPGRSFRVMRPGADGALSTLFRGQTSSSTLELEPGLVLIVLEGANEEELGPFLLRPGTLTTLRTVPVAPPEGPSPVPAEQWGARHWWEIEQTRGTP